MEQITSVLFVVSGGAGNAASQVLNTLIVQFPECHFSIQKHVFLGTKEDIHNVLNAAKRARGLIFHTLLDRNLRKELEKGCAEQGIRQLDLISQPLDCLTEFLGRKPKEQPGLYHQLNREYFRRIGAIEFSIAHDDNQNLNTLSEAEVVLLGVSRVGKTPLSMYLAVQGWKVANLAIVKGIPLPEELESVDRRRIIGLIVDMEQLLAHRKKRVTETGLGTSSYAGEREVFEESEFVLDLFKKRRYTTLNVTLKPIESSCAEVVSILNRFLGTEAHLPH